MGFYEMIFYFLFIFYKFINEGGGGGEETFKQTKRKVEYEKLNHLKNIQGD